MSHPIQVEKTFRELMLELELTSSVRQRFALIRTFILSLNNEYNKYDSYLLQLAEEIPLYSGATSYSGIDPALLDQDVNLLQAAAFQVNEMYSSENFRIGLDRLIQVCILQYCHAGALEQAVSQLDKWLGKVTDTESPQKQNESFINEETGAQRFIRILMNKLDTCNLNAEEDQKIRKLCNELDETVKEKEGSILIPVVELHVSEPGGRMMYGRLLRISVVVKNEHGKDKDLLIRKFHVAGGDQPFWPEGDVITEAARSLIQDSETHLYNKRFLGEVVCELKGAVHEGNSINAAIAALWYTGLGRYNEQRSRHEINSNICISGDLQPNGRLIPVDESGIAHKAEAVFFSWCTALVVPSSQLNEFEISINNLRKRYPNRELIVLGLDWLHEIFYDRRLTSYTNPSTLKHALRIARQNKYEAAGILTILILATIILRLTYGPLDKNPTQASFTGEVLQLQNKSGSVIDEIHVGHQTVNLARAERLPAQRQLTAFADLNGNGKNEIIWGEIARENVNQQSGFIRSKKVNSQHTNWSFPLRYKFDFPFKPEVIDQNYLLTKVMAGDYNSDGNKLLILTMDNSVNFPGILSLRDANSGEEISHFVNIGHIWDFNMADITGDGRKEVVFVGINNSYNSVFLAVLDIDKIEGKSPANEEFKLNDYDISPDIRYLLIPSVVPGWSFKNGSMQNRVGKINVMEDDQIITVRIYDTDRQVSDFDNPFSKSYIEFYFNYDLSLLGNISHIFYENRTDLTNDDEARSSAYNESNDDDHQDKLLYWNGEQFVDWQNTY